MNILKYIAMADANLADEHVPNDDTGWVQTDKEGQAFMKVLWTAKSGGWAVLYRWKKGYVAPAHKHLGSIHAFIVSGRLKLRDLILEAGDYMFEPNGMIHGVTEALEDTVQLNIADGAILFFNETSLTHYAGWEQMQRIRERGHAAAKSSGPTGFA